MREGSIIQVGTPREIYRFPTNPFVASFIGETNFISGKIQSLSNRSAEIETEIGVLHSTTIYHNFTNGETVTCCIRPESIHLEEVIAEGRVNQLSAKVLNATYLGRIEEYHLALAEKLTAKAVLYNPRTHSKNVGDTLSISVSAEDVIPLPAEVFYSDEEEREVL